MLLSTIQTNILKLCQTLKLVPDNLIPISRLELYIPIEKQLDEYRELIIGIEKQTLFFSNGPTPWSKNHAYTLDEYLLSLYEYKHDGKVEPEFYKIRPRPTVIENKPGH